MTGAATSALRGGQTQPGASVAQALEGVPIGHMLGGLALDLCRAQHEMDLMAVRMTEVMSGRHTVVTGEGSARVAEQRDSRIDFDGERVSLLELGLTPTFLQMVDTTLEIKLSISLGRDESSERRALDIHASAGGDETGAAAHVTAVDARFSSRFQYSSEGSSSFTTRLVPVPAPTELIQLVKQLADEQRSGAQ